MTQGLNPYLLTSLTLAGRFFTTALPRKPDISSWLDLNCASLADTAQRWGCVLYGIITRGAGLWIVPSLDKMAFARLLHQETTLLLSVINMYFLKLCLFYLFIWLCQALLWSCSMKTPSCSMWIQFSDQGWNQRWNQGWKPGPRTPLLRAWSPSHWTTREVSIYILREELKTSHFLSSP